MGGAVDEYLLHHGNPMRQGRPRPRRLVQCRVLGLKRVPVAWLRWRGLRVFYRGQRRLAPNTDFLSSVASGERAYRNESGIEASVRLADDLVSQGISPGQMTAKWDAEPVTLFGLPPELQREVIGEAGIPFSTNLPVAAAYAQGQGQSSRLRYSVSRTSKPRTGGGMNGNQSGSPCIESAGS